MSDTVAADTLTTRAVRVADAVNAFFRGEAKDGQGNPIEGGRGCPTGYLQYVLGFTAKEIAKAKDLEYIESGRGKDGGFFPKGEKPETAEVNPSLKADLVQVLRDIVDGKPVSREHCMGLIETYEKELATRKAAQEKARAEKAAASSTATASA